MSAQAEANNEYLAEQKPAIEYSMRAFPFWRSVLCHNSIALLEDAAKCPRKQKVRQ